MLITRVFDAWKRQTVKKVGNLARRILVNRRNENVHMFFFSSLIHSKTSSWMRRMHIKYSLSLSFIPNRFQSSIARDGIARVPRENLSQIVLEAHEEKQNSIEPEGRVHTTIDSFYVDSQCWQSEETERVERVCFNTYANNIFTSSGRKMLSASKGHTRKK